MKKSEKLIGASAICLSGLSACTPSLHHQAIGPAEPITSWEGLSVVFRDGDIYFSSQPTEDAMRAAQARGIKVVVNLRMPEETQGDDGYDERKLAEGLGMDYVQIPVTPPSLSLADADKLRAVLEGTSEPTLIHCASANRVGALWALYLHHCRGISLEDAIQHGRHAGLRSDTLIDRVEQIARDQPQGK